MMSELNIPQIRLLMLMKAADLISRIYSRIDGVSAPESAYCLNVYPRTVQKNNVA
jgi:hypothetical protein